jgi:hypothetical protein
MRDRAALKRGDGEAACKLISARGTRTALSRYGERWLIDND